jgi:hypothetical protein
MKKIKVIALAFLMMSITLFGVSKSLESQTPGMVEFLDHEGYPNAKVESVNPLLYKVNFKSDSGYVSVRSYKGVIQIVY